MRNFSIKPSPPPQAPVKKPGPEIDFKALIISGRPSIKKARTLTLLDLFDTNLAQLENLSVCRFVALFIMLAKETKAPSNAWLHINQKLSSNNIDLTKVIDLVERDKKIEPSIANKIKAEIKPKKSGNPDLDMFNEFKYLTVQTIDDLVSLPQEVINIEAVLLSAQQKYKLEHALLIKPSTLNLKKIKL